MEFSINEVEYCKYAVSYEEDQDVVKSKRKEIINQYRQQQIPGFRKGKATDEAVNFHFSKQIHSSLQQQLAYTAAQNVITDKELKPFGQPGFDSATLDGNKFSCKFSLHTQPSFELGEYKCFEIPKPMITMSADELAQKMLQELRVKCGSMRPFADDEFVQIGDYMIANHTATIDDKVYDKYTAIGSIIDVGSTGIQGFDEQLVGMVVGETREFTIKMPKSDDPETSEKDVKFSVSLTTGSKKEPVALDESLAEKAGFASFDVLLENVKTVASSRVIEAETSQIFEQISNRLVKNHDFRIPAWISLAEAKVLAKNANSEWDTLQDYQKEMYISNAEDNIKLSLVLNKIREKEVDAQLTDEELFSIAKYSISKFTKDVDKTMSELYSSGRLPIFLNKIKDEHTLETIKKTCTIKE
jgi:trigger factor